MSEIRPRADCPYCEQTFEGPHEWAAHIAQAHADAALREGVNPIISRLKVPQPEPEVAQAQMRKLYALQQAPILAAAIIEQGGIAGDGFLAGDGGAGHENISDLALRIAHRIYDEATK